MSGQIIRMYQRPLSPSTLIDVSELRIEQIRWSGSAAERQIVNRLFENRATYRYWENYHAGLMRRVGGDASRKGQLQLMRRTRFELIHRQAFFQYLRDSSVVGRQREELFSVLYGTRDYAGAVVAEHARFLHSNSSLYCADHLAFAVMHDLRFSAGLVRYRHRYLDYFGRYCDWITADAEGADAPARRLLPRLKQELQVLQRDLLTLPAPKPETQH